MTIINATEIVDVSAWEVLDSRGRPTVAARVHLRGGAAATARVPSGASTGSHEARELRDGGFRYGGRGVQGAVDNVNGVVRRAVVGVDAESDGAVDEALRSTDASATFDRVGANAVLSVSIAAACAVAQANQTTLARYLSADSDLLVPMPMVNIISGGAHAGALIDIQDLLAIPSGAASFSEAIRWCAAIREATAVVARERGHREAVLVADEGGLGLALESNRHALELLMRGIEQAGFEPGDDVHIALDIAANEFYDGSGYQFTSEQRRLSSIELIDEVQRWCAEFPIASVEDLLAEDDWDGWAAATARLADRIELVGDDLFVTTFERVARGVRNATANSVLVKVNQVGTLTAARQVLEFAHESDYRTVVSARSGETEDSWLADLAVGWRAGQIKVGSTHGSERTAKWNRLLELENTERTTFAGPWRNGRPDQPKARIAREDPS